MVGRCSWPKTLLLLVVCGIAYGAGALVLPFELYVLATAFVAAFAIGLIGTSLSRRWWTNSLSASVCLPVWSLLGVGVWGALVVGLLEVGRLHLEFVVFAGFIAIAGAHLLSIPKILPSRHIRVPLWGVGATITVSAIAGIGRYVFGMSAFELVLLAVFAALTSYIGLIVPVGLLELGRADNPETPSAPYPLVSVIIPAYNESAWIDRCVESVLESTYPEEHLEVLVIDDGSEDDTFERAARREDPRLHVLSRPNGGRAAARNYGFFCANGELLVTLDADSLLDPDAIDAIVAAFQRNAHLGAVAGDLRVLNADRTLTKIQAIEYIFSINTFRRACSFFNSVPVVPGCLAGFRRDALEEIHWFDMDTVTEDFDATLQILRNGWNIRQIDAIAWTEVPFTLRDLYKQRIRWYSGTLQCVIKHGDLYRNRNWSFLQLFAFPLLSISFVFRPIAGAVIAVVLIWGVFIAGTVPVLAIAYFFGVIGVGVLATLFVIGSHYRTFPWYVFLLVGYRQFIDLVFLRSIVGVGVGADGETGTIQREGAADPQAIRLK